MAEWLKIVIPLLGIVLPLAGGIFVWGRTERSKLKWERRLRKEGLYRGFLESISGFYAASPNPEKKEEFLQELRLAWLYCPDDVIKAGNAFLDTVAKGARFFAEEKERALADEEKERALADEEKERALADEEKERALAEFFLALRGDLLEKTELTVDDHRNWRST